MKIDRRVVDRKRQLLIPVPPEARDHLSLVGGARVWWHVGTKGRLTLTATGQTRAGKPRLDSDCPTCTKYRAELERLRGNQATTEGLPPVQLFWAGFMLAVKRYGDVPDRLDGQREMLSDLRDQLRDIRTLARELFKRSAAAEPRAWPFDHDPWPSPSPSPVVSEGEAVTTGPSVPGHP
jgi:hypothetical protein